MSRNFYATPAIRVSPTEEITIVLLRSSVTRPERMALIASYLSTLQACPATHREIAEQVLNLFALALPELQQMSTEFTSMTVHTAELTYAQADEWLSIGNEELLVSFPTLPQRPGIPKEAASSVDQEVGIFAGVASVLYSIGHEANSSTRAALQYKRPDALICRFDIPEDQQLLLPGRASGPTVGYLEKTFMALENYTEIRHMLVSFLLAVRDGGGHSPLHLDVLMTNFQLMRGAGMTHVVAILQFCKMHPWSLHVPYLKPYYHLLGQNLEQFERIPEAIRPYHRLLVPRSEYLFLPAELCPLIAVAGSFIAEIEETFAGYIYDKDKFQKLIAAVREYAPNYRPSAGISSLAISLGLRDEALPERNY